MRISNSVTIITSLMNLSTTYGLHAGIFSIIKNLKSLLMSGVLVLDPRMSYSALKDEFENDIELSSHLEMSKDDLHAHYKDHYAPQASTPSSQPSSQPSISAASNASPQKNFISRFNRKPRTSTDELLEFWSLPQERSEEHTSELQSPA